MELLQLEQKELVEFLNVIVSVSILQMIPIKYFNPQIIDLTLLSFDRLDVAKTLAPSLSRDDSLWSHLLHPIDPSASQPLLSIVLLPSLHYHQQLCVGVFPIVPAEIHATLNSLSHPHILLQLSKLALNSTKTLHTLFQRFHLLRRLGQVLLL